MANPTSNALVTRVCQYNQDFVHYFNPDTGEIVSWIDGNGIGQGALATAGSGAISSIFGRSGIIVAQAGDYSFSQISGTPPGALPSGVDVGSGSNAYVVNPIPAVTATFGASFTFTTTHANTGAATVNASGTGVLPLRTILRQALTGTEISGDGTQTYQVVCDGSRWLLAGTLAPGVPANPAGNLNLAGAYLIPTPTTGNSQSSTGFTLLSTPGNSQIFDRNLLNFVWLDSADAGAMIASFGFDGDDVFLLTGTMQAFAIEIPTEIFRAVSLFNQFTGDDLLIQQNNTPAAGAGAIAVLAPITAGNAGARIFVLSAASGAITTYNGVATVSNGVPAEYATVDLTGQTAAINSTTLYMPAATGWYRISVYAKVTTPDGASSSLGGSAGLTIGYTDGVDSTVQTLIAQLAKETGATAIVNAGNTTATKLVGQTQVFAKTGVAITYAFDYTSGTPATMAYELHLKVEAL